MSSLLWVPNLIGWPVIHLAASFLALRIPSRILARDSWLTAPRSWEQDGQVYRDWLAIRKWKSVLPDGAPWLGGSAGDLGLRAPFVLFSFFPLTIFSEAIPAAAGELASRAAEK